MKPFLILIFIGCLAACKQHNQQTTAAAGIDTTRFFPIAEFIKGEIAEVNKTPYFIYMLDIHEDKTDSTPINTARFNELSQTFVTTDISSTTLKKDYRESVFFDETTRNYTISYSTTNKDLEVQNAEVLLEEDGKKVKRILIRKFISYADSSVIEQLSWKPAESFQINRSVTTDKDKEDTHQVLVVWNQKQ